ncbi:sodium-dependent transporter, SNF family [Campylobacter sp. RM12651]|nr:sodium-dependent transporter, SNF family [Campylobacter sp. RM12651]
MVGTNGGSAFVLLYLFLCLTLGLSLFLAEIALGKITKSDLATSYFTLARFKPKLCKMGGVFMLTGILVLSFYLVVLSLVFHYIFLSFSLPNTLDEAGALFNNAIGENLFISIICFSICFFMTIYIVSRGIINGIEKLNVILMPALFVILLLMLGFSFTQDGFLDACEFLFKPDFSKLGLNSLLDALGLSLFTLCLGIGCISTYAASLDEKTNILKSSLFVVFINLLIGLMMGLIVFTFVFKFGANPNESGAGLVFISLATLFSKFGFLGEILSFSFFIALFFAGITSAVSMIEPFTFYLENKMSRKKALIIIGIFVYIIGILALLGMANKLSFNTFDALDFFTSNIMLPLGVLFSSIYAGFLMKRYSFFKIFLPIFGKNLTKFYFIFLRFVTPIIIILILINNFYPLGSFLK